VNSFNNSGQVFTGHSPINYGTPALVKRQEFAPRTRYVNKPDGMTDLEYQGYLATCEESYDITKQTLALYTLHPNALYAI
jgi:hypothetical protein